MRALQKLLLIASFLLAPSVFGEGLPLPWPFPWARECGVDWTAMQGTYSLADDNSSGQLVLKVSPIGDPSGLNMAEISRFAPDGTLAFYGMALIGSDQRSITVFMVPTNPATPPLVATFNQHYLTAVKQCNKSSLVPIFSTEGLNSRGSDQIQYKLTKISCDGK